MIAVAKITAKGQTRIPADIRAALQISPGDTIAWESLPDGSARVRRILPLDLEYLQALEGTLLEWQAPPTRRPAVTYEPGQVVRVPFPFTDRTVSKNRPALCSPTRRPSMPPPGTSCSP